MVNPHLAAGRLSYGAALADATLVVVAVHGRGQSPTYIIDNLIEPLEQRAARHELNLHHIAWILPGAYANSWYPLGFMAAIADNEPWLGYALDTLADIESSIAQPIVWTGFSQGGCLAAEHVARPPRDPQKPRPAGLICLTGGLLGPPEDPLHVTRSLAGMPAYFSNSEADEWVSVSRTEASAEAFRAAGADTQVEVIVGRPHEISAAEVESIAAFLRRIVG